MQCSCFGGTTFLTLKGLKQWVAHGDVLTSSSCTTWELAGKLGFPWISPESEMTLSGDYDVCSKLSAFFSKHAPLAIFIRITWLCNRQICGPYPPYPITSRRVNEAWILHFPWASQVILMHANLKNSRHNSFYCTSVYCSAQMLPFLRSKSKTLHDKTITTCFLAILAILQWSGIELMVSPRYVCTSLVRHPHRPLKMEQFWLFQCPRLFLPG